MVTSYSCIRPRQSCHCAAASWQRSIDTGRRSLHTVRTCATAAYQLGDCQPCTHTTPCIGQAGRRYTSTGREKPQPPSTLKHLQVAESLNCSPNKSISFKTSTSTIRQASLASSFWRS